MKQSFEHLDKYRVHNPEFSNPNGARYGAFSVPTKAKEFILCIADDGLGEHGDIATGWEHVSAHVIVDLALHMNRIPTWAEMCEIKRHFWDDDEVVLQYHIDGKRKVDVHSCTLHLWRPCDGKFPLPDPGMV